MSGDERHLFGDEQAYITWKLQQEAEARAEAYKAAQARKKRRRVKYSERIRKALDMVAYHKRMARLRANPEQYATYRANTNVKKRERWSRNAEHARVCGRGSYWRNRDRALLGVRLYRREHYNEVLEKKREHYQQNREGILAQQRRYRAEHKQEIATRRRRYRVNRPEAMAAKDRKYRESHVDELKAKKREYYLKNRERISAKDRAKRAAKKAAQQQQDHIADVGDMVG